MSPLSPAWNSRRAVLSAHAGLLVLFTTKLVNVQLFILVKLPLSGTDILWQVIYSGHVTLEFIEGQLKYVRLATVMWRDFLVYCES